MFNTTRPQIGNRFLAGMGLAVATLLLAGCATVPEAPHAALAEAKVAISTAEKDNAAEYAGPDLTDARQQLVMANSAVTSKQMTEADRYAHQSRIAAELASARTEAAKAAEVNEELSKGAKALNDELKRSGDRQ
jgi:DMSO/TMAO reductase YedYZ molybdopterin-dependent catalytic subunit